MNFIVDIILGEEGKVFFYVLWDINFYFLIILIIVWIEFFIVVEFVKVGVVDYLLKLWDDVKLFICVNNLIELGKVK